MKKLRRLLALGIGVSLSGFYSGAWAQEHTVNCPTGSGADFSSLQAAINDTNEDSIRFKGTCNEDLEVTRFVEITGDFDQDDTPPFNGTINGDIDHFAGAMVLEELTIAGTDAESIWVSNIAEAFITDVTFGDNSNAPSLQVFRTSNARIGDSTFNPITGNRDCSEICVFDNSFARIENSIITGQQPSSMGGPVQAFSHGTIRIFGGTVTNNGTAAAISSGQNSYVRIGNFGGTDPVTVNGGVEAYQEGMLDIRAATINDDANNIGIDIGQSSFARIDDPVTVNGDNHNTAMSVGSASTALIRNNATFNGGDVACNNGGMITNDSFLGTGGVNCPYTMLDSTTVGIGTSQPDTTLHVQRSDNTAKLLVEDTGGGPNQALMHIKKTTAAPFFRYESQFGTWDFSAGFLFVINDPADAAIEMTVEKTGDMTILGALTQGSSRDSKHEITSIDTQKVLEKVVALPLSRWSYKENYDQARHLGPMSEDFYAAFGLGKTAKGISSIDSGGVALAAIQGLYQQVKQKDAELAAVKSELKELKSMMQKLSREVNATQVRDPSDDGG